MSDSDQVLSEGSNASSTSGGSSAYSSPSQQVPQFTLRRQGGGDDVILHKEYQSFTGKKPHLNIIEQPQEHFIFRYKSEKGRHGCIAGRNGACPAVQLIGHNGGAKIDCELVQPDNHHTHAHMLLRSDEETPPCSIVVPNDKDNYVACFHGMIIIHTSKADVEKVLFDRHMECHPTANSRQMLKKIKIIAKSVNLNVVLLKFTARDMITNEEICSVISEPISNSKSVATNQLTIGRYLKTSGRAKGGEDMIILTSKVSKNTINVNFFDDDGWSASAKFLQCDVWHQYAIVCRTPPYKDTEITSDVTVYIQLVRTTDGSTSEAKEFIYKADPFYKNIKKRKLALEGTSSNKSIRGNNILAISTSEMRRTVNFLPENIIQEIPNTSAAHIPQKISAQPISVQSNRNDIQLPTPQATIPQQTFTRSSQSTQNLVRELHHSGGQISENIIMEDFLEAGPMDIVGSEDCNTLLSNEPINHHQQQSIVFEELGICTDANVCENSDIENDFVLLPTLETSTLERTADDTADDAGARFARAASVLRGNPMLGHGHPNVLDPREAMQAHNVNLEDYYNFKNSGISLDEFYDLEVVSDSGGSKLLKEIYDLLQNGSKNKGVLRNKLEALCEIRSSDGGTFLFMMLTQSLRGFEHIVTLLHVLNMSYLLNLTDDLRHTLLHRAVAHDLPELVTFLVSKGCDPMIQDHEGNNVIHHAVMCKTSLRPLLDAIKSNDIAYEIDASNFEKQTPLHLAVIDDWESGVELLLQHGASHNARDSEGRTPLHLATYDDYLRVTSALLHSVPPAAVDAVDGRGYTALQIACGGNVRRNTLQIIKELLVNKADPSKCEGGGKPARVLARRHPLVWAVVSEHMRGAVGEYYGDSSASDEDFHTADEDSDGDIAASLVKMKL